MKLTFLLSFLLFSFITFGQELKWIPFNWFGGNISGKYYDKLGIVIPVSIDSLSYHFVMQLDLGAETAVINGNTIAPYLDEYNDLKNKLDTSLKVRIKGHENYKFKGINLKLGNVSLGNVNIGYFKNFGKALSKDSIKSKATKFIGVIGTDIFQDKILVIDYKNKRICVAEKLPERFEDANFKFFKKTKDNRIKIPMNIDGNEEDLLFDTGSSLFALITNKERAEKISNKKIIDSLNINNWGEYFTVYGERVNTEIKFGEKQLAPTLVYFDKQRRFDKFFEDEKIWGITGNAYFLNNIIIIDYKNDRFGIK